MDRLEYICIQLSELPEHIIKQYNLTEKSLNGYVYVEIRQSIYGLPQAGAQEKKVQKVNIAPNGYFQVPHTPELWRHITCPIAFSLVVDNFGVQFVNKADDDHLIAALKNTMKYQNARQVYYTVVSH